MPIFYVWGFGHPAPHRLGNATRVADLTHHEKAHDAALESGFDVAVLTDAGTSAWATAYSTPDGQPFEPGKDGYLVAGFTAAHPSNATRRTERRSSTPPWET